MNSQENMGLYFGMTKQLKSKVAFPSQSSDARFNI